MASFSPTLRQLDPRNPPMFSTPIKEINDATSTLSFWLKSQACSDILTFLMQLNYAMFPQASASEPPTLDADSIIPDLKALLLTLQAIISEAPPDPGPRRFGNTSFRKWHTIVEERIDHLLRQALPVRVWNFGVDLSKAPDTASPPTGPTTGPLIELKTYLMGSFGNAQRLDYGTGHEVSFLAFLGGLWKLSAFADSEAESIVIHLIQPYLDLIRLLIKTYTLEPAGSHGVWGLDDHSFVPYIFGSAQLSPSLPPSGAVPTEGSSPRAPKPGSVTSKELVEVWREKNMYFDAIGFIYDVKRGPFWEHSPMLYDISGVTAGWAKINKGMLKMYRVEVLSKFPVVQHFVFGGLFRWVEDDSAVVPIDSKSVAQGGAGSMATTAAPWAQGHHADGNGRTPARGQSSVTPRATPRSGTAAPWAASANLLEETRAPQPPLIATLPTRFPPSKK